MAEYTQVYSGQTYEFTADEDLKKFLADLDAQGTGYSTEFFKGKAIVSIV